MACSDYDHLSFDTNGAPCGGTFTDFSGVSFELYKNWVYAWAKDSKRDDGPLSVLYEGRLSLGQSEVVIVPSKTLSCGILIFIKSTDWNDETKQSSHRFFAGIACNGYDDGLAFRAICKALRVKPDNWEMSGFTFWGDSRSIEISNRKTGKTKELTHADDDKVLSRRYSARYVGVTKRGVKELIAFLTDEIGSYDDEALAWLEKLKAAPATRYNQGDAFFAHHLGTSLGATAPSAADKPVAMQMLGA